MELPLYLESQNDLGEKPLSMDLHVKPDYSNQTDAFSVNITLANWINKIIEGEHEELKLSCHQERESIKSSLQAKDKDVVKSID